jgi:hypothetical protein
MACRKSTVIYEVAQAVDMKSVYFHSTHSQSKSGMDFTVSSVTSARSVS